MQNDFHLFFRFFQLTQVSLEIFCLGERLQLLEQDDLPQVFNA